MAHKQPPISTHSNIYIHKHSDHEESHGVNSNSKGSGSHSHTHGHTHTQTKAVVNRLSRAIGHLEAVKNMVEDGRDCTEVLAQLVAVRSAINNTGKVILQDHIEHCIVDAVESGDLKAIEELNKAIAQFVK